MTRQVLAIANCRVSSDEQLQNNSLNRQQQAVLRAAKELGVTIPDDGWWSGSVSSKRGTNLVRKDLLEMIERCKKDKRIKYVIVDEPDRFMRSIDEAAYFEVTFRQLGVTVYYASDPELNKGDLASKLLKFTKYLSAEGSNEERQRKSISGQTTAMKDGRYTFHPKAGYKRGYERGIPELHEVRGPILRTILVKIATKQVTPTQGLIELNRSDYTKTRASLKMDKFRTIATDPFYAGILVMDKQVKVNNPNGKHEPLISLEHHYELVKIFDAKKKTQVGPRKNGNPKFPLSNIVSCDLCTDKTNGRFVGFDHGNGKNPNLVYEKYRCRACGRYLTRQELHQKVEEHFKSNKLSPEALEELTNALDTVWKQNEVQAVQNTNRIKYKIKNLQTAIANQVEAVTDPANAFIKDEIMDSIASKKQELSQLEEHLTEIANSADDDKERFLKFAFDFLDNMGSNFFEISVENRLRCKQIIFPAGFYLDSNNKVYTPEISLLYRLATKKKDAVASENSHMVRVRGL